MRVMSTFSGISAATVALKPLGYEFVAYAEPSAFPAHVLSARCGASRPRYLPEGKEFDAKHYADLPVDGIPNFGDVSQITDEDLIALGDVDVLEGGSPCQAFSMAGARRGLADARGNLTLMFVALALRMKKLNNLKFVIWENVRGVLNHVDNPLGCFLGTFAGEENPLVAPGGKWTDSGHVVSQDARIAWRVLDSQFFGVAQRRKRVWACVSFDPAVDPGEVLFEPEGEGRLAETLRAAWQDNTRSREAGTGSVKGVITKHLDTWQDPSVSPTLLASDFKEPHILVHPVQNAGNLGAQEGTGIGGEGEAMFTMLAQQVHGVIHPLYSIGLGGGMNGQGVGGNNDPMYTLTTMDDHAVVHEAPEVYPILNAGGMSGGPLSGPGIDQDGAPMYTVISSQIHGVCHESEVLHPEVVGTLMACGAGTGHVASAGNEMDYVIVHGDTPPKYIVRRLMPVETEILQGFPPGHTDVLFKGKPATDNVRYRATGNSMTTFCLRFIGARLKHYAEAAHASKDISALEDAA